jgi:hypothetical protein
MYSSGIRSASSNIGAFLSTNQYTCTNYLLQLATSTLASVATTGSGPRGNIEEEFAGSDGDE